MKINHEATPGTVFLVDLDGTVQGAHSTAHKDVVLVPRPSRDPNDPLNWSFVRKFLAMTCLVIYTMAVGVTSAAIYSVLGQISEETGLTVADLNTGTGYMFLMFGVGCLFWQPLALNFGKRPVYLASTLATALITIWAPHSSSNGAWIGGRILTGFLGAPIESLVEISISDIWFEHERATWMGVYAFTLVFSNFIAPLVAGFINDGQGWQWVLYWCSIFSAVSFVVLFFLMEETNFHRPHIAEDALLHEDIVTGGEVATASGSESEKRSPAETVGDVEDGTTTEYRVKTFIERMSLTSGRRPTFQLWTLMWRPITFFRFPVVVWAGFCYGSSLVWFNVMNATTSLILGDTYGWKASFVGLSYIAPIIGVLITTIYSGYFSDVLKLWFARRNHGVSEPEHRLWLILPLIIICPAGLITWGVGAAHHVLWIGPVVGMGMLGCIITYGCAVSVNYCVDSYHELSGEAMVTVILIRNVMSFAIGYGITPWIDGMGYQNTFITAAGISIICLCSVFIMIKWGKHFRDSSKHIYWGYVEQALSDELAAAQ